MENGSQRRTPEATRLVPRGLLPTRSRVFVTSANPADAEANEEDGEATFAQLGPYEITGLLGEGGMGVVYRARHRETGELAALKTVLLPNPVYLSSIRREIQRLRRLSHPGVVRVLDDGVHEGLPWCAMELLEGATWERARQLKDADGQVSTLLGTSSVQDAVIETGAAASVSPVSGTQVRPAAIFRPVSAEELPALLGLTRRLCDTLAYIHGEGVVHRDLKPANVFLRSNGQPTLVDFGLVTTHAGAAGREELDVNAMLAGTVGYMAPEQLAGDLADARADIFALGCMLYESLTGRLPFPVSFAERARRREEAPPPPSRFAQVVPPALDELVLRMLAIDPRERIGHAYDVASALAAMEELLSGRRIEHEGGGGAAARGGAASSASPSRAARAYLYRASFAGRGEVFERLVGGVRGLAAGRGGMVLIEAVSGGGKTRLMMEVARRAAVSRVQVVAGECAPIDITREGAGRFHAAPLHPLRPLLQAVADQCRAEGRAATERLLGKRLWVLAPFEPTLATVPGAADCPEAAPLALEAAKDRVLAAVVETLALFTEARPLLLLIDDLQWADSLTLDLLAHLARPEAPELRALIFAAYRSEEPIAEVEALAASARVERVVLGHLDEGTVGALIGDMLGVPAPPFELVRFVSQRAEGNPFFVTEYLRTAVDEGFLRRNRGGQWSLAEVALASGADAADADSWTSRLERLALPRTVRDVVERHLRGLDPGLRDVVLAASVLGRDLRPELLAGLARLAERDLADALNELLRRQILELGELGGYRFAHDKLRETAYDALSEERRRALHRAAAEALEGRGEPHDLEVLASHWDRAHVADKARHYLMRGGEAALASGAHAQGAELLARALELTPPGVLPATELARMHNLHADALFVVGDPRRGTEAAERALALLGVRLPRRGPEVALAVVRGVGVQLLRMAGRNARGAPSDESASVESAKAAVRLSTYYVMEQRSPLQVMMATLLAANLADRAGPRGAKAVPYSVLGATMGFLRIGPLERRYFQGARRDALDRGDRAELASSGVMECSLYQGMGRWAELDARAAEGIALASEIGDQHTWETLSLVLSGGELLAGRLPRAAARLESVRRSAIARGAAAIDAWVSSLLGAREIWADRPEVARGLAHAAARGFERDSGASIANAHALSAAAAWLHGDRATAIADAGRATARLTGMVSFQMWPACDLATWTLIELWDEAKRHGRPDAPALRELAVAACARARSLSRTCKIGAPIAARADGMLARVDGHPRRARALLGDAVTGAKALAMPVVEVHARLELALLEPPGSRLRNELLCEVERRSRDLGCALWRRRALALLPSHLRHEADPVERGST